MSTATTATSSAATHLLNTKQEDKSLKIVSNGQLVNNSSDPQDQKLKDSTSTVEDADADLSLGPQVSLKEQIELDKDDASLRKWKEQLLGSVDASAVNGEVISKEPEVKILRLSIQFPGRPDIVRTTPYRDSSAKSPLFTLKEGAKQQATFEFVVSKNIVCGLKYICDVWKKGIKVDSNKKMVGTFGPREEPYKFQLEESTIPTGFFVRGTYTCRTKFVDDDGKCHFEANYYFEIQKNWGASE